MDWNSSLLDCCVIIAHRGGFVFESGSGYAGLEVILVILDAPQGFAVHGRVVHSGIT